MVLFGTEKCVRVHPEELAKFIMSRDMKGVLSSVPTHGFLQTLHINNSLYTDYENVFIELDS